MVRGGAGWVESHRFGPAADEEGATREGGRKPCDPSTRILGNVGAPGLWCSAGIPPVLGSLEGRGYLNTYVVHPVIEYTILVRVH